MTNLSLRINGWLRVHKHLSGRHNQKRHGWRGGSLEAVRRAMRSGVSADYEGKTTLAAERDAARAKYGLSKVDRVQQAAIRAAQAEKKKLPKTEAEKIESSDGKWWIMDSHGKLATPEKRAKQRAEETKFLDITVGTDKQIQFAKDLRSDFLIDIKNKAGDANVRWAVVKQTERNEKLNDLDISYLARDAWNRRSLNILNTNDAKKIIDFFKSIDGQVKMNNAITRYQGIIRSPEKWTYSETGGWKRK